VTRRARVIRAAATLVVTASAVLLTGCGSSSGPAATGLLPVVAAENFYGDLAAHIGGPHVKVTSILSNPNADPHLFEPGSRTGLSVSTARVVIRNGAGYDDWMSKLLTAAPSSGRQVVTIAEVLHVTGSDPNPHLWYDVPALPRVITAIGDSLTAADPAHSADYRAGVSRTLAGLRPLQQAVSQLKEKDAGTPVAYTERVPGLLLAAAGLRVLTPPSFARAIEDGTDPTPADVLAMRQLLTSHRVRALLYNEQATSPLTAQLQQIARTAGVPIVPVTETEPAGASFAGWQLRQVQSLAAALGS
jgi:zinc/manganese transport system substrate-binding protein